MVAGVVAHATCNDGEFIVEQIKSIQAQFALDWRLLVRNDGPSNVTVDLVKSSRTNSTGAKSQAMAATV